MINIYNQAQKLAQDVDYIGEQRSFNAAVDFMKDVKTFITNPQIREMPGNIETLEAFANGINNGFDSAAQAKKLFERIAEIGTQGKSFDSVRGNIMQGNVHTFIEQNPEFNDLKQKTVADARSSTTQERVDRKHASMIKRRSSPTRSVVEAHRKQPGEGVGIG